MVYRAAQFVLVASLLMVLVACAPAQAPGSQPAASEAPKPAASKRTAVALLKSDLAALRPSVDSTSNRVFELMHAGFARLDPQGEVHAQLAEAVPTLENGLWKVFPDGRMETTWKIRTDARWHDGTPVTSDDFLFGTRAEQDREIPWRVDDGFQSIAGIEAPDTSTVTVQWRRTYILADAMTGSAERLLPEHLLEQAYLGDKGSFLAQPYWTTQFVGAGPYKVKQFVPGSGVVLEAFEHYVLGRPKLDEIEVKFIASSTTLAANLLAGAVELTLGTTLSPDEAVNLRDQWRDGVLHRGSYRYGGGVGIAAQSINPTPAIVGNLQFRRAMLHAIDRQALVDTIMAGMTEISPTIYPLSLEGIESSVVSYAYDPRRAAELIEGLGYRRGAADGVYQDASGQKLSIPLWAIEEEQERVKSMLAAADDWKRLGIDVQPFIVPAQQNDLEYLYTYPAFFTRGTGGGVIDLQRRLHSTGVPLPANGFRGNNLSRYMSPELDALIETFFATIPKQERTQALGRVVHHVTDQVVGLGLFYQADITMINNRLANVTPSTFFARGWDAHLWDAR